MRPYGRTTLSRDRWDGLARLLCNRRVFTALGTAEAGQMGYAAQYFFVF